MKQTLFSLSLPIAWILSPESLVLLGNIAGHNDSYFFLPLLTAALLMLLMVAATANDRAADVQTQGSGTVSGITSAIAATALALSGRFPVTLLAATGMLVTAGFVFNEVFVYWFPNFGFAFLLLGLILLLNLIARAWAYAAQTLFVVVALGGLLALIAMGLTADHGATATGAGREAVPPFSLFAGVSGILLFLGIDLYTPHRREDALAGLVGVTLTMLLVALLWAAVSLLYVPPGKLADSTIPYTLAARAIAGESGRLIMGAVIIAGACGVVNALFLSCLHLIEELSDQGMVPTVLCSAWAGRFLHLVFAVAIGVMMMTGLAGEEDLEMYFRGALLLWLLHIGVRTLALTGDRDNNQGATRLGGFSAGVLLLLACAYLLLADQQAIQLVRFCITILTGGVVLAATAMALNRLNNPKPSTQPPTEDTP